MKLARSQQLYSENLEENPELLNLNINSIDVTKNNQIVYDNTNSVNCSPRSLTSSNNNSFNCNYTLNEEETWRGHKNVPMGPLITDKKKNRPTKCTNTCSEIDRVLNRLRLRSQKRSLIMNGNLAPQYKIKSLIYIVTNICQFRSVVVVVIITHSYTKLQKKCIKYTRSFKYLRWYEMYKL